MAKYRVTYHFLSYADVEVEAEDKMDALKKAAYVNVDEQIVSTSMELDRPDVELIEED